MDFQVEQVIHAAPADVAAIMFDPALEKEWITNATKVEVLTPGPLGLGARISREGGFMGRTYAWVWEVTAFDPGRLIEMTFVEGPAQGAVTFEVSPTAGGSIAMVHVHSKQSLPQPITNWFAKHDVAADLARLARLVAARQAVA
jgi:uncharacterized protein YndB with AHSA1/START domain